MKIPDMNRIRWFFKKLAYVMSDAPYSLYLAEDSRWLLKEFTGILDKSKAFVYVCQTSSKPLISRSDFRDALIQRTCAKTADMDIKVLVRQQLSEELGYWDSSFRVTEDAIGDFILGDAGAFIIDSQDGSLFKIRPPYPDEGLKEKFVAAYTGGAMDSWGSR